MGREGRVDLVAAEAADRAAVDLVAVGAAVQAA
jgi:hypothetical protein